MSGTVTDLDLLTRAARLLHGSQWQRALARDLGVSEKTVQRWKAGEFPVPLAALFQAMKLLDRRGEEIDSCALEIGSRLSYEHEDYTVPISEVES